MTEQFKYRAFLSYSHADVKWAEWLHRGLENYRVPVPLIGTQGSYGPIPKTLFPIYRDRDEFRASADLAEHVRQALEQASHLIVICSPSAVRSHWVNDEITAFKKLGRESRILALIVDGEPNASEAPDGNPNDECFPAPLKRRWKEDSLSPERIEPAAADARPTADGKLNAKLKIIAGIIGVDFNVLKRREVEASRRRTRFYQATAGAMALLAIAAIGLGSLSYFYLLRSQAMAEGAIGVAAGLVDTVVALSGRLGVSQATINRFLVRADAELASLYRRGVRTPSLQHQRAKVLMLFADYFSATGDSARELARAQEAVSLMQNLNRRFPQNVDDQSDFAAAEKKLGDVFKARGEYATALKAYRSDFSILLSLSKEDPLQLDWQKQQAAALSQIGYVLEMEGDLSQALDNYRAALAIRKKILSRTGATEIQHEIAVSQRNIGDALRKEGQLPAALASFQSSAATIRHVADLDPGNAKLRYELAGVEDEIGDVLTSEGALDQALAGYREARAYREALVAFDPTNREWVQTIGWSDLRIGDILDEQGKIAAALDAYQASLKNFQGLVRLDPRNAVWQRSLYISEERVGLTLQQQRKFGDARRSLVAALWITRHLAAMTPRGSEQNDVANCQDDLGELDLAEGNSQSAQQNFRDAAKTVSGISPGDRSNVDVSNNLARSEDGEGEALLLQHRFDAARPIFQESLAVREKMRALDSADATVLHDAAMTETRLAVVEAHLKDWPAAKANIEHAETQLNNAIHLSTNTISWRADYRKVDQERAAIGAKRAP